MPSINVHPNTLNSIVTALQHSISSSQNALVEVNQQISQWQQEESAKALALQQAALSGNQQGPGDAT